MQFMDYLASEESLSGPEQTLGRLRQERLQYDG